MFWYLKYWHLIGKNGSGFGKISVIFGSGMGPVNGPKTKQGKPLSHKNLMSDTIVHQSDY